MPNLNGDNECTYPTVFNNKDFVRFTFKIFTAIKHKLKL